MEKGCPLIFVGSSPHNWRMEKAWSTLPGKGKYRPLLVQELSNDEWTHDEDAVYTLLSDTPKLLIRSKAWTSDLFIKMMARHEEHSWSNSKRIRWINFFESNLFRFPREFTWVDALKESFFEITKEKKMDAVVKSELESIL